MECAGARRRAAADKLRTESNRTLDDDRYNAGGLNANPSKTAIADPDFHETFFLPEFDDRTWKTGVDAGNGLGYGDPVDVEWPAPPEGKRPCKAPPMARTT